MEAPSSISTTLEKKLSLSILYSEILQLKIEYEKEINELKLKVKELEHQNILLKKEIEELKITKEKNDNLNIIKNMKSSIINEEENILIKNYINPNQPIRAKLLYKLSRDGNTFKRFHELCDNQGPTLVLFKTVDGMKTGGYTPLNWDDKTNAYKEDWDTFVFSLNKKEIYRKNSKKESIYCGSDHGPYFKQYGINSGTGIDKIYYYSGSFTFQRLNTLNKENFQKDLREMEVFKIFID